MGTITANGTFKLSQLMEELVTQVPTFRRATGSVAAPDMGTVSDVGGDLVVTFADDIPAASVQAVIDAHVPQARVVRDFSAELDAVTDIAGLKAWLKASQGLG